MYIGIYADTYVLHTLPLYMHEKNKITDLVLV